MEWTRAFKEERKADWADIVATIREVVSMDEVVRIYTPHLHPRHHRIPCPFHNGKDYNLSFTKNGYKCFVCGVSGDVVSFVKNIQGCATRADAMRLMNADLNLHLPIDGEITAGQRAEMAKRRAEAERKVRAKQEWEDKYNALWDEYTRLDHLRRTSEPFSDDYAYAVTHIDHIAYQINSLPIEPR